MNLSKRYSVSKLTILVLLGIFTFMIFNQDRFKKEKAVIEWDVIGYYAYLPALFIYNDLTLNFMDGYNGPHKFRIWPNLTKGGKKYIKYTMGLSFLYAPFFFIGHAAASIFSYDAGGIQCLTN